MQDAGKMTNEELTKELDAFYAFVKVFGYGYLTEEGLVHFNALRGEHAQRVDMEVARMDAVFSKLEAIEDSYRKHFGPIPPLTSR